VAAAVAVCVGGGREKMGAVCGARDVGACDRLVCGASPSTWVALPGRRDP